MILSKMAKSEIFSLGTNIFMRSDDGEEIIWYKKDVSGDFLPLFYGEPAHMELERIHSKSIVTEFSIENIESKIEEALRIKCANCDRPLPKSQLKKLTDKYGLNYQDVHNLKRKLFPGLDKTKGKRVVLSKKQYKELEEAVIQKKERDKC